MLHRNGTRLDIGTSDDVAELELAEARRAAETQRRHQRVAVSVGGPRTAGSTSSTVLSYGSVSMHTRTPGRPGTTAVDAPAAGEHGSGRYPSGREAAGVMASPIAVTESWRSPSATTTAVPAHPSPSATRPSYPFSFTSPTAAPLPRDDVTRDVGAHFPDISSIVASGGRSADASEGRLHTTATAAAPSASATPVGGVRETVLSRFSAPFAGVGGLGVEGAPQVHRYAEAPHGSPYDVSARSEGPPSARRGPQARMQWPPPPSVFLRTPGMNAEANAWDEEQRQENSEDMEPSPTRRSGLLPPE